MNYYERHIGDYARDAGHLTMLEHGAYSMLLDRYYSTEKPIPEDQAHRVCRARTRDERDAVDSVLKEFFTLQDGMYQQKRVDMEIARYMESEPDRQAKRENERDRQRRTRERRKELFGKLRDHGVVPSYDATMSELHALLSRATSQPVTQPVTRDDTATQTPDTSKYTETKVSGVPPDPIFGDGLAYLVGSGVDERGARSFLGKLRKSVGDLQAVELIAKAQTGAVSEPLAWLRKAAERRIGSGRTSSGVAL